MPYQELLTRSFPGLKKEKPRITLIFYGNATGSDRIPVWIIWNSKTSRVLLNTSASAMGACWRWNQRAWVNSEIIVEWLQSFYLHIGRIRQALLKSITSLPITQPLRLPPHLLIFEFPGYLLIAPLYSNLLTEELSSLSKLIIDENCYHVYLAALIQIVVQWKQWIYALLFAGLFGAGIKIFKIPLSITVFENQLLFYHQLSFQNLSILQILQNFMKKLSTLAEYMTQRQFQTF